MYQGGKKSSCKKRCSKRRSRKRSSKKKRSKARQIKRVSAFKSYRIGRPSPNYSATLFPRGTRRVGGDGEMWEIKISSNGVRRWSRS
jgi:hypothetical protein